MANIENYTRPINGKLNYFINGTFDGVTQRNTQFNQPAAIATSLDPIGNPLVFDFSSEIIGSPQNSKIYIDFTGNPGITSITFFDIVFTESIDSNLTSTQFYNNTFTIAERIDSLVDAINQNINLNWRYTAFNDNNIFCHIVAKQPGSVFSITAPYFSMIPNLATGYVAGADSNRGMLLQNYNYRCFVELFEIDNVEWNRFGRPTDSAIASNIKTRIASVSQPRNTDNQFSFDLSKFFDIEKPVLLQPGAYTTFTLDNSRIKCYYLRFGESFIGGYDPTTDLPIDDPWNITNTNVTRRYIADSDLRWYANGTFNLGLANPDFYNYWVNSQYGTTGVNTYQTVKPLTMFEDYKLKRRIDEPEYISVYLYNDEHISENVNIRLSTNFTFVDGTVSLNNISHLTNLVNINGLYTIDANLVNINFHAIESASGKRILHYESVVQTQQLQFASPWVDFTSELKYRVDLNNELDNKYKKIWRYNKLGAIDQFEFEGFRAEKINYNAVEYSKSYKNSFYERNRHINQPITKKQTKTFTLNSGWLTTEQIAPLKSLCASNQCYWLSEFATAYPILSNDIIINTTGNLFEAINIVDATWLTNNIEKLFNLEITVEIAIPENSIV